MIQHQDIQDILDARDLPYKIDNVYWTSHFRVNNRIAKSYSRGRIFLAGDACHTSDPFLGLGQVLIMLMEECWCSRCK